MSNYSILVRFVFAIACLAALVVADMDTYEDGVPQVYPNSPTVMMDCKEINARLSPFCEHRASISVQYCTLQVGAFNLPADYKKAGPQGPLRFGKRKSGPSGPLRFGKRSGAQVFDGRLLESLGWA